MVGQVMSEYALILGGVALVLIVAFVALQTNLAAALKLTAEPAAVAVAPLTPLGSTFTEISNGMINLVMDYYRKHNRWPRSWGDFAFTDLGLDPKDWQNGYNGIIYKPVGNRVTIRPAAGYTFVVRDINGNQITLPSSRNWSLVYNMQTGTWHHKNFDGPRLDISSLQVIPPNP
jgi:Flp pilus assembly pilin Flp